MCGIAGGVPPEVVEYDRFAICQWAGRDAFLDLRALIAQQKPDDPYRVNADDYVKQTWEECQFRGGQYGIPNYMDDRALYYNEDLLIQGGFKDSAGRGVPPSGASRQRPYATNAESRAAVSGNNAVIGSAPSTPAAVSPVAPRVMIVRPTAAIGVSSVRILSSPGRSIASPPRISQTPMNRTNSTGRLQIAANSSAGIVSLT